MDFAARTTSILAQDPSLHVFPIAAGSKKQSIPTFKNARRDDFPDSWNSGHSNIGVTSNSDVYVIDVDTPKKKGEQPAIERLRKLDAWSEETWTVKTPRGLHFYWRCDTPLPKQYGGNSGLGKNVDTRNPHKGYVLGPGSIVEGKEFQNRAFSEVVVGVVNVPVTLAVQVEEVC